MSAPAVDEEEKVEQATSIGTKVENIWKQKYYFLTYATVFIYIGIFFALPSVIFNALEEQMNVSQEKMASLYTYFAISGSIWCIFSGFVVEKFPKMHYLIALFCVLGVIAMCLLYFVTNFIIMVFIWVVFASVQYFIEVSVVVLVFRVFAIDSGLLISFYYFIATISSAIVAPLFNAFYNSSGNYSYCMYILSAFGVLSTICLLILPSPQRSNLVQNVENIKNDIVSNNIRKIEDIEKYKKDNTNLTYAKTIVHKYSSSPYIQSKYVRNRAVIEEQRIVYRDVRTENEAEDNILYNLFMSTSYAIRPYSTTHQSHDLSVRNPIDEAYWFDFEQKRKKKKPKEEDADLSPKRKNVTNTFAVIAVLVMLAKIIQRVSYNAFIVEVASDYFSLSEASGYYMITANWIGSICGLVLTVLIITKFNPDNVMLFCAACMVINSILYIILLFVHNSVIVEVLMYFVAIQTGFWQTPIHTANLTFLSHIQPVTGFVSASIMVAEAAGRGIAALITTFVIEAAGHQAQIYIHLATSITAFLLLLINKIRYIFFLKSNNE